MTTETPTLRQELDRKVIDYLHNRESRRLTGNISPEVIGIEAGALWDVLCGLIDEEASSMLSMLEGSAVRPLAKRYFLSTVPGAGALVLSFNPATPGWVLVKKPDTKVVAHSKTDAGELRTRVLANLVEMLLKKHYVEIT